MIKFWRVRFRIVVIPLASLSEKVEMELAKPVTAHCGVVKSRPTY